MNISKILRHFAVTLVVALGMDFPELKVTLKSHPRLVFSIPNKAPESEKAIPGGKCSELLNETVREVRLA